MPKLTIAVLGVLVGVGLVVADRSQLSTRTVPRVTWPIGALLAVAALTTLTSTARADSFFGRYERYGGLLPLVAYLVAAALVYALCAGAKDRLEVIAAAVLGSAALCGLYVAAQVVGVDPLDWREPSGRVVQYQAGTLGNSNFAGAHLGIALAFAPALFRRVTRQKRWVVAVAAVVSGLGVLLTQSRGGILAAATAVGVLAVAYGGPRVSTWPRRRQLLTAAALLVAFAAVSAAGVRTSLARTESLEIRLRQWRAAVAIAADHPVVGTGPDTFQLFYPEYRTARDGRELGLQLADKPHNLLLDHASGSGMPGALSYVALVVSVVVAGVGAVRRSTGAERDLAAAFLAAAAAHVAQGLFSIDVPSLALVWWFVVGGVAAAGARAPRAPRFGPHVSTAVLVIVALVLALAGWGATRPWRADWASAAGDHERAVRLHPAQAVFHLNRGAAATGALAEATDAAAAGRAFTEADEAYASATDLQPRSVYAHVGAARLYATAATKLDPRYFQRADDAYRRTAALDPVDWQVHDEWARLLNAWSNAAGGDRQLRARAIGRFERVVEIRPDHLPAWQNIARLAAAVGDTTRAEAASRVVAELEGSAATRAG